MVIYTVNLSGITNVIEVFESVIWNVQAYGLGDFQLIVPYNPEIDSILQIGVMLARETDIYSGLIKDPMLISGRKLTFNAEKGWMLEVHGNGLKSILKRRIFWSQTNFQNHTEVSAVLQAVTDNAASPSISSRAIPNLVVDDYRGDELYTGQVPAGTNLAEWIEQMSIEYDLMWGIDIRNGKYMFYVYFCTDHTEGSQHPVIFSEEYENIASVEYDKDTAEYINVALIGGEGEGTSQVIESIGSASGIDRYEGYVDGGSVSSNGEIITMQTYRQMLQAYGREQMTASKSIEKVTGELITNGQFTLGTDYGLGSKVTVKFKGMTINTKIIELIYAEDANGYSILPTFSEWEVT